MSATSGLEVKIDRMNEVLSALDGLDLNRVLVGVPEEKSARDDDNSGVAINNAQLAWIHEYGAPNAGIPPRPFLEPGIMHAHDQIVADSREGARKCLDDLNPNAVKKALEKAGMHTAAQIQQEFTDNDWEPLKHPRPKKGRSHRRGAETAEKPLIDTGVLRRSITYVVREKGE